MEYQLFKILTTDNIPNKLLKIGEKREYLANEVLKNPDEEFDGAYILLKGYAAVKVFSNDSQYSTRFILKPPCIMGEVCAINGEPNNAIFQFLKDSMVLFISREKLINLIKKDDELFTFVFDSAYQKMMIYADQFDKSIFLKPEVQVAALFYEFAEEFGEKLEGYIKINFDLNQQLMTDLFSLNRSTVIRAIKKLKKDNYISQAGRCFIVKDLEGLKKYICEYM